MQQTPSRNLLNVIRIEVATAQNPLFTRSWPRSKSFRN